jgi:hypothetical protein
VTQLHQWENCRPYFRTQRNGGIKPISASIPYSRSPATRRANSSCQYFTRPFRDFKIQNLPPHARSYERESSPAHAAPLIRSTTCPTRVAPSRPSIFVPTVVPLPSLLNTLPIPAPTPTPPRSPRCPFRLFPPQRPHPLRSEVCSSPAPQILPAIS